MLRKGSFFLLLLIAAVLAAGCSQEVEFRTEKALSSAKKAFEANAKAANHTAGDIRFYKPPSVRADSEAADQQLVLTKKEDAFYVIVNPNDKKDSRVFYDEMLADEPDEMIGAETFSKDGAFGFAAVLPAGEKQVRLVVNAGGVLAETITEERNMESYAKLMMEMVRSVSQDSK